MAHFAGLVAAGLHPNPVEHCDFVTSTTHKTLAGPRAGFILCREEHAQAVDRAVFPGMQGGPLEHTIAAKATCFKIAMSDAFREYQQQIRANADVLAETLQAGGLELVTGGTDTHLMQIDLRNSEWTGKAAEERLHEVQHHRQPQHRAVRRAAADGRVGRPHRHAGDDDARLRRGRLPRDRPHHLRRARPSAPDLDALRGARRRALREAAALPGVPRLHDVRRVMRSRRSGSRSSSIRSCSTSSRYLRDKDTPTVHFRKLANEITLLLTYEATKDLPTEDYEIETPLERMTAQRISGKKVAVCPVLRAGVGMLDGVLSLVSSARVGFIGMYRDEETLQPVQYYSKLPTDLSDRDAIVLDPMLATGHSSAAAIEAVKEAGAQSVTLVCIVAAPPGHRVHPRAASRRAHRLRRGRPRADERGFIVPGLGDAGDRLYGTKYGGLSR